MTAKDVVFVPENYFRQLQVVEIFPNDARPLEVDLGCGDGRFLEQMAALYPGRNFLGVERLIGRVDKTARRIARRGLGNARVLRLESSYAIAWLLPPRCVSRLHLLCPDPWPKKAHRKNRIINNKEFLAGLRHVLTIGGEFLLKSDEPDFFENSLEVMNEIPAFERQDWNEDDHSYPPSTFESQWLALGKPIHLARWKLRE